MNAIVLKPVLSTALLLMCLSVAAAPANAAITITKAEISGGRLVVTGGRSGTAVAIRLDDKFSAAVDASGNFTFSLTYLPPDCIVDLQGDGGTAGSVTAIIANCGPRGLTAKGAWNNTKAYVVDDVVTDGGSSFRAKAANSNKAPDKNPRQWEVLAFKGARGIQGAAGPAGQTGDVGPTGEQGPTGATGPAGVQGPAGAQGVAGSQGPQGVPGGSPFLLTGTDPGITINGSLKFIGPVASVNLTASQKLFIQAAKVNYTGNNQSVVVVTGLLSFCHKRSDAVDLTLFLLTPSVKILSFPASSSQAYSFTMNFAAAQPGSTGTYQIGVCIKGDVQPVDVHTISISEAVLQIAN